MTCIGKKTTIADGVGTFAEVDNIGDISASRDEIDNTTYGPEEIKTYCAGLKDYGSFDIVLNYDSTDASHNRMTALYVSGASEDFTITYPDASTFQFTAFVAGLGMTQPLGEKIQRTYTLKIDGQTTPAFSELTP